MRVSCGPSQPKRISMQRHSSLWISTLVLFGMSMTGTVRASVASDLVASRSVWELAAMDIAVEPCAAPGWKRTLWAKYRQEQSQDATRRHEYDAQVLQFDGRTMRYAVQRLGSKPATGYP